jgi:hypothetical protein
MAIPQTTYPADLAVAFNGMLGDGGADRHTRTYTDDTNETFFGRVAIQGTNADEFVHPSGSAGTLLGITHHTHDVEVSEITGTGDEALPATQPANVLSKGRVWVIAVDQVTDLTTDAVHYLNADGRLQVTATAGTLIPTARWLTLTSGPGELALVEIGAGTI